MGQRRTLNKYRGEITFCNGIIILAHATTPRGRFINNEKIRSFLTESAFLKMFIAWETFLEESFLNYLTGRRTILNTVVPRYAKPTALNHAINLTVGVNAYFDWSRPDAVIKLSKLFFDNGDPFHTTIAAIQSDVFDMKTIRNAAAHLSSTTSTSLDSLSSRLLGIPITNMKASNLLLTNLPGVLPPITIMNNYIQLLDVAVQTISEG